MPSNLFQVTLGATAMEVTPEPIANNSPHLIGNGRINSVSWQFAQKPLTATPEEWMYRYPTLTVLTINLNDGNFERIELQDITNQGTWSTGTMVGIDNAINAINAWLIP